MADTARYYRIRASQMTPGGHVHVRFWAGPWRQAREHDRPSLGTLTMDVHDWAALVRLLTWAPNSQVEVDTDGLLDFDGTGSSDADMHLVGFRGFTGCPHGDCPGPGICSAKGDCLDLDPPNPRVVDPFPGLLGEDVRWEPCANCDNLSVEYQVPDHLDRVWVVLSGGVSPRPGSIGWALTFIVDDHPVHLVTEEWRRPGEDPCPVQHAGWIDSAPGRIHRVTVRLDGADWAPSRPVPTMLRVTDRQTPSPWAPAMVHLRIPRPE